MKGMELCRRFFEECVRGIWAGEFPAVKYSAGLIGFGSDVLGYDDEVSQDHDWGPRLYIFLDEGDMAKKANIWQALCEKLPRNFLGYPVIFGEPNENGVSAMEDDSAVMRPRISIQTFGDFMEESFGMRSLDGLSPAQWLAFSEHKLLSMQAGRLFRDELGIGNEFKKIEYYPEDVRIYLIMSDWSCLAEERAFVKRASSRGDDIGSRIVCARLAHRIMHLCFLYEKKFAAYSKWFGTRFNELECAGIIKPLLEAALSANDQFRREEAIALAQVEMIKIHNKSNLTDAIPEEIHPYYTRDIKVADSDLVYLALTDKLKGTALENVPPMGSISTVGNLVVLTEDSENIERIAQLYK